MRTHLGCFLAWLTLIAMTAASPAAHGINAVNLTATSGCSPNDHQVYSDTFLDGSSSALLATQTCTLLTLPPQTLTEVASDTLVMSRVSKYGTLNGQLPFTVELSSQTTYDSNASASVTETIFLQFTPPNADANSVLFSLTDHTTMNLSTGQPAGAAVAYLQISAPEYPGLYAKELRNTPGSYVIDVTTPSVLVRCCQLLVQVTAFTGTSVFATATLSDPLTVVLDPAYAAAGWTWSFADAPLPVPEPQTWLMLGVGIAAVACWRIASVSARPASRCCATDSAATLASPLSPQP